MEYPGSKFTQPYRRAFFLFFLAIFLVSTPLLIMYSAGYRYDWQNGLIRKTGALSVDVLPKEAAIFLNGVSVEQKIPIRLKNMTPGKYLLTISSPDHYDWKKEIEIKPQETVYVKDVELIKRAAPRLLIKEPANYLSLSRDNRFLAYSLNKNDYNEVWLFDLKTQTPALLTRLADKKNLTTDWNKKNNYLAISDGAAPHDVLLLVDAENTARQINLPKLIGAPIEKFVWKNTSEPEMFFSAQNKIYSLRVSTQKIQEVYENNFLDWEAEENRLWVLSRAGEELKITRDLLGFKSEIAHWIEKNAAPKIMAVGNNSALVSYLNTDKMVVVSDENKFETLGNKFLSSPFNNWWLFWTPWELNASINGEEPTLLIRSSENLNEVAPLDKNNTLLLMWQNRTDVLFPYYSVQHELINSGLKFAVADSQQRILYFAGKLNDQEGIWSLNY